MVLSVVLPAKQLELFLFQMRIRLCGNATNKNSNSNKLSNNSKLSNNNSKLSSSTSNFNSGSINNINSGLHSRSKLVCNVSPARLVIVHRRLRLAALPSRQRPRVQVLLKEAPHVRVLRKEVLLVQQLPHDRPLRDSINPLCSR